MHRYWTSVTAILVALLWLPTQAAGAATGQAGEVIRQASQAPGSITLYNVLPSQGGSVLYLPLAPTGPAGGETFRILPRASVRNGSACSVVLEKLETVLVGETLSRSKSASLSLTLPAGASRSLNLPRIDDMPEEPTGLTVRLYFNGFSEPSEFQLPVARPPTSYPLFSVAGDLEPDVYWRTKGDTRSCSGWHCYGTHGVQRFAYDIHAVRWNPVRKVWRYYFGDRHENASHVVWGLPVRAIASGTVTGCVNDIVDNPHPPDKLDFCGDKDATLPCYHSYGGNQVVVQQDDGEIGYYYHLQKDSLSPEIFPACKTTKVRVTAGEMLGRVGNSGQSGGPHLHIQVGHRPLLFHSGASIRSNFVGPGDVSPFRDLLGSGLGRHVSIRPDCWNSINDPGKLLIAEFRPGSGPAHPDFLASCEQSTELDGWLGPEDFHLTGDFTGLGYDQKLVINNSGFGERLKILEYAPGVSSGEEVYLERWGDSTALNGWHNPKDRVIAGDFMGLGYDQVLFINTSGAGGRLKIVSFLESSSMSTTLYREDWGESTALNGWHNANDLLYAGDFMGFGHDQLLFINRSGRGGRVKIVDFSGGTVPAKTLYRENWGDSTSLDGWHNANDRLLVGDFMGLGYDQVLFINNSGHFGRLKVSDFHDGKPPAETLYREDWGESTALNGWHNANDFLFAGDFLGLGRDQVLFINNSGEHGRLKIVDFAVGTIPAATLYREEWGDFPLLDGWHDCGDLLTVGDFMGSGSDQLLFLNAN